MTPTVTIVTLLTDRREFLPLLKACINNQNLIHAYGPAKKVIIMPIDKTLRIIKNTAGLKVKKVFSI